MLKFRLRILVHPLLVIQAIAEEHDCAVEIALQNRVELVDLLCHLSLKVRVRTADELLHQRAQVLPGMANRLKAGC